MASPPTSSPDVLTGVLERIIFLNEENHYTIAEFRREDTDAKVTIVGPLPGVQCGETLHLRGGWTRHREHGDQFRVDSFTSELPSSVYGIRKYLGSGLVPGIGKVYANQIVDAFGRDTFRVLSEESGRLRRVPGIGPKRAAAIKQAWEDQRALREIYIFLQTYGVSPSRCVKLVNRYGGQARQILMSEPYRVAREIEGIGFKTADRIAINLGFANDAPPRLDAGILYALEVLEEDGHTAYREADLRDYATELLQTEAARVMARIDALVADRQLVRHEPAGVANPLPGSAFIQLPANDRAEQKIAATVARLARTASGLPAIKADAAVAWAQGRAGFTFHPLQATAIKHALTHKVSILTGGPGTGKAQPLDALVLTPTGFRRIGSLRPGDWVVSAEGAPVRVKSVHPQGTKPVFTVIFADGRRTRCCNDHLWKLWTRTSIWSPTRRKKVRARGWRVVPLAHIRQRLDLGRAEHDRMGVPLAAPWAGHPEVALPCDPYVLGALIGDGNLKNAIILTSADRELVERVAGLIRPMGLRLNRVTLRGRGTISWRIVGAGKGHPNPLRDVVTRLGLAVTSEEKSIPEAYLNASTRQRIELIRGLLDTDGTVDKLGVVSFTTTSRRLAAGFQRLAWSLGCVATVGAVKAPAFTYRGQRKTGRPAYTIFVQHPRPETLFHLSRKRTRTLRPKPRKRFDHRLRIAAIEPAGEAECVCISIDSSTGLYVTDDYVVTHNTTILHALVAILKAKRVRVHLAAPTGRASQRLAETTGGYASTIHRLLKFDAAKGGFTVNEHAPLGTDFLIVDESSMLDTRLAAALLAAVPSRAHLLLVGDVDQLPSVGAGNVLKDLIACGVSDLSRSALPVCDIPVTRLTVIYRQEGQSLIVTTAHAINAGDPQPPPVARDLAAVQAWSDLNFIAAHSAADCLRQVLALCTEVIPRHFRWLHPITDVQVLAPMHKGVAGVANLNQELQNALNPAAAPPGPLPPKPRAVLRTASGEFRPGDKLIQLRNNYDKGLFNGEIGVVVSVDPGAGSLVADFDGERHVYERGDFGEVALAYCISIHKSQGSEYPAVVIPLLKEHFLMLQRNLLYTALTRGKKKVFLVGDPAAYMMAVRNSESRQRCTHLREKLLRAAS